MAPGRVPPDVPPAAWRFDWTAGQRALRAGEPACRPGSVIPLIVTWEHSPAMPSELLFYLSRLLISFGVFSPSGGTETELAAPVDVLDSGDGLALVLDRPDSSNAVNGQISWRCAPDVASRTRVSDA